MNWCDEIVEESSYCTINILNTKFYCWKSSDNARVMVESGNGDFYKTVNSVFPGGNKQRQCQEKSCRMQRKILFFVVDFRALLKKRREKRGETQRALRKPPAKNHSSRKQHRFGVFVGCKCLRIRRRFVHCARRKTAISSLTQKFASFFNVAFKTAP